MARFVPSYVFKGADEFATWIVENFESFVIEDAFSADGDKKVFNHGMPEVFMDFITLQKILLNNNFFLYIEYMYFDYPANTSQCINMRVIGTKDANFLQKYQELYGSNTLFECDSNEPYKFLSKLCVDKNYLKSVKHNKSVYPVWAETPINYSRNLQRFLYILNRFKIRAYKSTVRTGPNISRTLMEYLDRM